MSFVRGESTLSQLALGTFFVRHDHALRGEVGENEREVAMRLHHPDELARVAERRVSLVEHDRDP